MKKRITSIIVAILMIVSIVNILPVITASAEDDGDYNYTVLDDETIKITKYNGNASDVDIPNIIDDKKVTIVGQQAFTNLDSLISVTIPNTITTIEYAAFYHWKSLP